MRSIVVALHPLVCYLSYLVQCSKDVGVKNSPSVRTFKPFYAAVLCQASGLRKHDVYPISIALVPELIQYKFGRVVATDVVHFPLSHMISSRKRITRFAGIDGATFCATTTRSKSSIIFSTRNFLLLCNTSVTKSMDYVTFSCSGVINSFLPAQRAACGAGRAY